jgi:hypothetical protein
MLADMTGQSKQGIEFTAIRVFANDRIGLHGLYFPLMYFTDKFQLRGTERD